MEKVVDGKGSGYFTLGIMTEGLKPIKKGDAMQEIFTTCFSGEMEGVLSNMPNY
jgi:hypothetical protein